MFRRNVILYLKKEHNNLFLHHLGGPGSSYFHFDYPHCVLLT